MKSKLLLSALCLLTGWSVYGQKFVHLTQANLSQTVSLATDQALEIRLPVKPANGYGWYLKDKNKTRTVLEQIGDWEFEPDVPGNVAAGASGTQIIHFTPSASGKLDLELVLMRPWEGVTKAIDQFNITVVAAGNYTGVTVVPYVPGTVKNNTKTKSTNPKTLGTHPTSWSWLTQGIMTPVKDQGQCGSCWAFAADGTFEAAVKYWDNVDRDMSEQWLINCDANCNGCSGGWCPDAMFQNTGCVYTADLAYTAANGTCGSSYTYHEKITNTQQVNGQNPTDDEIKQAIYDHGPVWATIDAGNNFQNYNGGVMNSSDGTTLDHAIVLCGWDDSQSCWILRNSWGPNWGENNGYMRIGYGVSGVGSAAQWLDYKGTINHNSPPTPAFIPNITSTCTGAVQFTDQSINTPTSWLWNFGDGQTSTIQNPLHTYTSSGAFSVTLTVTNSYGKDSLAKSNLINVNLMNAPTTTGASRTGAGVVTLSASAVSAASLDWYDAATAGNLVNTGATYSPNLAVTTTFYVTNENLPTPVNGGKADSMGTGGYYTANTDRRLYFDVSSDMLLKSVNIYCNTAGSRQIEVLDSAGNSVDTSALINTVVGKNTIPLNFTIPAKNNYAIKLSANSAADVFRNSAGASYPYAVGTLASITGSDAPTSPANYYYYFYEWVVSAPSCSSARTPVIGTINTATGIQNIEANGALKVYPNPSNGVFYFDGLENENTIELFDVVGKQIFSTLSSNSSFAVDMSGKDEGVYFYRIMNTASKNIRTGKLMIYR